jgi:hypothetical protein
MDLSPLLREGSKSVQKWKSLRTKMGKKIYIKIVFWKRVQLARKFNCIFNCKTWNCSRMFHNSRKFMSNVKFYKCQLILFKFETFIVFCGHLKVSNYFKLKCLKINPEVSFDNSTPILRTLKLILFFPLPTVLRGWLVTPWQHA